MNTRSREANRFGSYEAIAVRSKLQFAGMLCVFAFFALGPVVFTVFAVIHGNRKGLAAGAFVCCVDVCVIVWAIRGVKRIRREMAAGAQPRPKGARANIPRWQIAIGLVLFVSASVSLIVVVVEQSSHDVSWFGLRVVVHSVLMVVGLAVLGIGLWRRYRNGQIGLESSESRIDAR
jgi:hypothetical protein